LLLARACYYQAFAHEQLGNAIIIATRFVAANAARLCLTFSTGASQLQQLQMNIPAKRARADSSQCARTPDASSHSAFSSATAAANITGTFI
jgi:methionine-rich copper-binding protein CopC